MEAAVQRRQHVAVGGVVVIARPIEIGGHQTDRIKAVLDAQRFRQLDPGNLGDRVPLVGGLQLSGEQGGFGGSNSRGGHEGFKISCKHNNYACGHSGREQGSTVSVVT